MRVLIADDHPVVLEGLAAMIGYTPDMVVVGQAGNGSQAVEMFRALSPDVGLFDLRMPELDGVGLYRELEQQHPSVLRRLAFVSGTTEPPEYASFLERTGATVLGKPFALANLQRLVQRLLQNQQ